MAKRAHELPVISLYNHRNFLLTPTYEINPRAKGGKETKQNHKQINKTTKKPPQQSQTKTLNTQDLNKCIKGKANTW